MNKVLVIAAHPDDEILGCGGTIAKLVKDGWEAFTLILGEGVTGRERKRDANKKADDLKSLKDHAIKANEILGVKEVFFKDLPDNRFDRLAMLDIVKVIEEIIEEVKPEIIFTHFKDDLNVDHQITYEATITAARPLPGQVVRQIYSFEVLSSTEWRYPVSFSPDVFFDISRTVDLKLEALSEYASEMREFPHPRSLEGAKSNAKVWGMKVGVRSAEAFMAVRIIR